MPRDHRPRFYSAEEGAEAIAHLCDKPRLHGASWQACCPAHEDRTPSFSITPQGERILLHCHAGCDTRAIVGALGLELRDLFAGPPAPAAPAPPPGEDVHPAGRPDPAPKRAPTDRPPPRRRRAGPPERAPARWPAAGHRHLRLF